MDVEGQKKKKSFKFGIDEYSRYVDIKGERFQIEPFPYWGWHPIYLFLHIWKRAEIIIWHVSRLTKIMWESEGKK